MLSKSYVFDPRPRFPFLVAAKRYWIAESADEDNHIASSKIGVGALTLVFIHGSATHKEHWEPTIQRLLENQQTSGQSVRFHDMWAIDLLNHGDAAVLNEQVLRRGYEICKTCIHTWTCDSFASLGASVSWEDHARGIHAFLSGLGTGVDVNFSKRTLVLVGHSMGAGVAMLTSTCYPLLKISSLHLIEPSLIAMPTLASFLSSLSRKAEMRKDKWSNLEEVHQAVNTGSWWKSWDKRIIKLFIEHGFRPLPTAEYPDQKGVTLKATKKQESANIKAYESCLASCKLLPRLLKEVPTHITYGTVMDFAPHEWQENALHIASGGISNFASVTRVPKAGHMIIQTHPDTIADIIWTSLIQSHRHVRFTGNDIIAAKL